MKFNSVEEIAGFFEVTSRAVRGWRARGAPISRKGEADSEEITLWRAKQRKGGGGSAGQGYLQAQDEEGLYRAALRKKAEEQTRKLQRENAKARGELVERGQLEQLFVTRIKAVTQGLDSLARALPPQLVHCKDEREMEEVIARTVRALRESFARPLPAEMMSGEANGKMDRT